MAFNYHPWFRVSSCVCFYVVSGGMGSHFPVSGFNIWQSVQCTHKSGIFAFGLQGAFFCVLLPSYSFECSILHITGSLPAFCMLLTDLVTIEALSSISFVCSSFCVCVVAFAFQTFPSSLIHGKVDTLLLRYTVYTAVNSVGKLLYLRASTFFSNSINLAGWEPRTSRKEKPELIVLRDVETLVWR